MDWHRLYGLVCPDCKGNNIYIIHHNGMCVCKKCYEHGDKKHFKSNSGEK